MASTSLTEPASAELLACILGGEPWPDYLLRRALIEDEGRALFSVVVERLGDLFEPHLADAYARLFARVVELLRPDIKAADLLSRYERVRQVRPFGKRGVDTVFVLSRVTLGADVAVTSVLLDALKRRFPRAAIQLVGPRKNWELFATDQRIQHMPLQYPRAGSLIERLSQWPQLSAPNSIVVDPDSRLTQLGILPVCSEADYFFFESRSYGADTTKALPALASQWAEEVFGVEGRAFIAPEPAGMEHDVAVSFGVGANPEKRVQDPFEEELLQSLVSRRLSVIVDQGGGGEETERVQRLCTRVEGVSTFEGPYAPFASMISQAKLYMGYDSAGQHVAAACGVPLVSVFAGYPSERMFQRWSPYGPGRRQVIQVKDEGSAVVLAKAIEAVDALTVER